MLTTTLEAGIRGELGGPWGFNLDARENEVWPVLNGNFESI